MIGPNCAMAENAAPGSCCPNNCGTMSICAVLLTGKNSVTPCNNPNKTACNQLIAPPFVSYQVDSHTGYKYTAISAIYGNTNRRIFDRMIDSNPSFLYT